MSEKVLKWLEPVGGILIVLLLMAFVVSCVPAPVTAAPCDIECTQGGKSWCYAVADVQRVEVFEGGHHVVTVLDSAGRVRVIDSENHQLQCDAAAGPETARRWAVYGSAGSGSEVLQSMIYAADESGRDDLADLYGRVLIGVAAGELHQWEQ